MHAPIAGVWLGDLVSKIDKPELSRLPHARQIQTIDLFPLPLKPPPSLIRHQSQPQTSSKARHFLSTKSRAKTTPLHGNNTKGFVRPNTTQRRPIFDTARWDQTSNPPFPSLFCSVDLLGILYRATVERLRVVSVRADVLVSGGSSWFLA